jgi:hypothetical protein
VARLPLAGTVTPSQRESAKVGWTAALAVALIIYFIATGGLSSGEDGSGDCYTSGACTEEADHYPSDECADDEYLNSDGDCVRSPTLAMGPPAGATAQCVDGTYSFSRHRSGTCSQHDGVDTWL